MSSLKFIAISGSTGVTENLYIYESGNDMIVVDCGIRYDHTIKFIARYDIPFTSGCAADLVVL